MENCMAVPQKSINHMIEFSKMAKYNITAQIISSIPTQKSNEKYNGKIPYYISTQIS